MLNSKTRNNKYFLNNKSFLNRIMIIVLLFLVASFLLTFHIQNLLEEIARVNMTELAKSGAREIEAEIQGYFKVLSTLVSLEEMTEEGYGFDGKKLLQEIGQERNILSLKLIKSKGGSILKPEYGVSEPYYSRQFDRMVILFSVPIIREEEVRALLFAEFRVEFLSEMLSELRYEGVGNSYLLDSYGYTLAHDDYSLVYRRENVYIDALSDESLRPLANLEKRMVAGETGAGFYEYRGIKKFLGFTSLNINNWSIAVAAPRDVIFLRIDKLKNTFSLMIVVALILLGLGYFYSDFLQRRIAREQATTDKLIDSAGLLMMKLFVQDGSFEPNRQLKMLLNLPEKEKFYLRDYSTASEEIISSLRRGIQREFALRNQDRELIGIWNCKELTEKYLEAVGVDISEKIEYQRDLQKSYEELTALYEEMTAAEEELQFNYEELKKTRLELDLAKERYDLVAEASRDVIWDYDLITRELYISERIHEILLSPKPNKKLTMNDWRFLIHPADLPKVVQIQRENYRGIIDFAVVEYRVLANDGEYRWLLSRSRIVRDREGNALRQTGTLTDFTERKEREIQIEQLALYDKLTGLPNKENFFRQGEKSLAQAEPGSVYALLLLDIDNFKNINDSFGHSFGDRFLHRYALNLRETLADFETCSLARIGGDEFVVLINVSGRERIVESITERIRQDSERGVYLEEKIFIPGTSIGIALWPEHGDTLEELRKNADLAMYRAKSAGKNTFAYYDESLSVEIERKQKLEESIRRAVAKEEFMLFYQPLLAAGSEQVVGAEALLRWDSSIHGLLSPDHFIDVAEESGIIMELGYWVIEQSCRFVKEINREREGSITVSFNVSAVQFSQPDFVSKVKKILEEYEIKPGEMSLEITESILIESFETVLEKLYELKAIGLKIALDDFGTGYSSLNYLKNLPIDIVKIDKSFIQGINQEQNQKKIAKALVALSQDLGLKVVAEGVENLEQRNFLREIGCDLFQGYLYSRPIPLEAFKLYLSVD